MKCSRTGGVLVDRLFAWAPFVALTLLPGCASGFRPIVLSAAPTKIVYRVPPERIDMARLAANEHCSDHKKRALFEQVTDAGGPTMIASFRCR